MITSPLYLIVSGISDSCPRLGLCSEDTYYGSPISTLRIIPECIVQGFLVRRRRRLGKESPLTHLKNICNRASDAWCTHNTVQVHQQRRFQRYVAAVVSRSKRPTLVNVQVSGSHGHRRLLERQVECPRYARGPSSKIYQPETA